MTQLEADAKAIVDRMFVDTADQNYVLARVAYFNGLAVDFYWLSAHAIEKYFKAILLLNGGSANEQGHDISALYSQVTQLRQGFVLGTFVRPRLEGLAWRELTIQDYLRRLSLYGNTDNRYLLQGFTLIPDDLMKVDQIVWFSRRHCRRLFATADGRRKNEAQRLSDKPQLWRLSGARLLERLVDGRGKEYLATTLMRQNFMFGRDDLTTPSAVQFASSDSPLGKHVRTLQSPTATVDAKLRAARSLEWASQRIRFSRNDIRTIQRLLAPYEAALADGDTSEGL